jgi:uncharacterized protein YndB with AHSA1/START domain
MELLALAEYLRRGLSMNRHPWSRRGLTIDFVQHIRADPAIVWNRISTEDGLQKWMRLSTAELPLSAGEPFAFGSQTRGRLHTEVRTIYGTVHSVVPEKLLALEYVLPWSGSKTYLSMQIQQSFALFGTDHGAECDLWIIHDGFPDQGIGLFEHDGYFRHWRQAVGDLAAQVEGRPGKPTPYALAGLQFVGGANNVGLLVADVMIDSPAHVAGIVNGDIIAAVDGRRLHSLDDFHDWIDERQPGESGTFTLQDRQVKVTVESVEQARGRFQISQGDVWVPVR